MFAKRPPAPAVQPAPKARSPLVAAAGVVVRNPMMAVGGAVGLVTLAAASALLAAGDPHAGAPSVRIPLSAPGAPPPPPGWREALAPEQGGPTPITTDSLQLYANAPPDGGAAPMQGQAIISFPGGPDEASGGAGGDHPPLPPAPLAGLTAPGPGGSFLPIIASDGRNPAQAYARPFVSNGKPRVALVIGGLGLNAKSTRQAIEQLPPEVTLSFVPYADGLQAWIDLARANGHEVLLEAPMEPVDYPNNDPGPYTLLTTSKPAETVQHLDWLLSRATGYFGVTNYLGSRFVTSDTAMATFSGDLHQRGLAFVDDGSAAKRGGGIPRASADLVVDDQLAGDAIDKQLATLEADALQRGQSLGSGFAYPITLDEVGRWAAGLGARGYQLAPASAVMARR
jgi:polysaccharide deacetylase 2 family uncharacterized protein YibQ